MALGHEKLHVYQVSISYVSWVYKLAPKLKGDFSHAKNQLIRASQSIPLNIAEGNGKVTVADRRKYFEISRGSAFECAAIQDVLEVAGVLSSDENRTTKETLDRIVAMLTKLGGRGYTVNEEDFEYEVK